MNIDRINASFNPNIYDSNTRIAEPSQFGNILDAAVRLLDETSTAEHDLAAIQMDFITGRTDDILAVSLAEQRAQTAVTFTTQLTSRVLDAYRQIMNLQV